MSPQRFNNPAKSCGCPLLSKDFDEPGDLLLIKVWMYLKRFYGPTSSFPRTQKIQFLCRYKASLSSLHNIRFCALQNIEKSWKKQKLLKHTVAIIHERKASFERQMLCYARVAGNMCLLHGSARSQTLLNDLINHACLPSKSLEEPIEHGLVNTLHSRQNDFKLRHSEIVSSFLHR